ncbi:MAG: HEAT repeat domain-containing protein [Candidatus Omnitrophica bacterium]|nr:HEAT repeat domain-containing protein [Candidatus Omnitrophota bacterium]
MKRLLVVSLVLFLIFGLVNMGYSNEQKKVHLQQAWSNLIDKETKSRLDKVIELTQKKEKDVSKLKEFLKNENLLVRGIAAIGLADENNPEGVRDLIGLLSYGHMPVLDIEYEYVEDKSRLDVPLWTAAEQRIKKLGKTVLPYLIEMVKDEQIIGKGEWGIAIGLIIRLKAQAMIIPEITNSLKHSNPQIQEDVKGLFYYTYSISYFAGRRELVNKSVLKLTVYELVKLLNHPVAGGCASSIIWHLNSKFPRAMRKAIADLLKDPDPEIRSGAVRIWGICRESKALPKLTELLSDKEPMVRKTAMWSIGIMCHYYDLPREKVSNKILSKFYKLLNDKEGFAKEMMFFTNEGKLMLQASEEQEIVFWTLKKLFYPHLSYVKVIEDRNPDEIVKYWKRKIEERLKQHKAK